MVVGLKTYGSRANLFSVRLNKSFFFAQIDINFLKRMVRRRERDLERYIRVQVSLGYGLQYSHLTFLVPRIIT